MGEAEEPADEAGVRPCRRCGGTGVDPDYHRRYTTGGRDERPCRHCGGSGDRDAEEQDTPD